MESLQSRGRAALRGEVPHGGVADGETRAAALARWGGRLAAAIVEGRSVLQTGQTARPPQTLPLRGERDDGRAVSIRPNTFRGVNSLVLRTVAAERGLTDTRFVMVETAKRFNAGHGDQVDDVLRNSAGRVMLPNRKGADEVYAERRAVEGSPDKTELVYFESHRRAAGVREYFHVNDLRLPSRRDRAPVKDAMRDGLVDDVVAAAERGGLTVRADADHVPGDAVLRGGDDGYVLEVGPADTFDSPDQHASAVVHECSRFHLCGDGHEDSRAVAAAAVEEREEMPELARSDLVASVAALDRVTEAGRAFTPPSYLLEHEERVRAVQAERVSTPEGLDELGTAAARAYRLTRGWSPTRTPARSAERSAEAPAPGDVHDLEPAAAPCRAAGSAARGQTGPDRGRHADERGRAAAPAR